MRYALIAAMGGLLVVGCAGTSEVALDSTTVVAGPPANVTFYGVAPPTALPLGPIEVTLCRGNRATMRQRLIEAAAQKGGNGITQLTCGDAGMTMSCWGNRPRCTAQAINIPPPPPPPPPKKTRRGKRR
jgi:hypothetical protein